MMIQLQAEHRRNRGSNAGGDAKDLSLLESVQAGALGSTKPPPRWIPGALSSEVKGQ